MVVLSDDNSVHAEISQSDEEKEKGAEGNPSNDSDIILVDDRAFQPEANNISDLLALLYSQLSDQITKVMTAAFSNSDAYKQLEIRLGKSTQLFVLFSGSSNMAE